MNYINEKHALSSVVIALFKGVLYQDQNPDLWQTLIQLQAKVH